MAGGGCLPGGGVSQHALGRGVCIPACTGEGGCIPACTGKGGMSAPVHAGIHNPTPLRTEFLTHACETSMHSSRMCTTRLLPVSLSMHCSRM